MDSNKYYKCITSENKLFNLNFKELYQYRELIYLLTKRSFVTMYRQTVGGWLWLFAIPIFHTFVNYLTFGGIAGLGTDGIPPVVFYLSGTALWGYFSTCITKNANIFFSNSGVFSKVYFPRLAVSLSYVFSSLIELLINLVLVMLIVCYFAITGALHVFPARLIILPFIIVFIGMAGMGVGIINSSLTTKYRDFSYTINFLITLWMPITPVMYPISEISNPVIRFFFTLNPLTGFMELFRYAMFGKGEIMTANLIWGVVFCIMIAFAGVIMFHKSEHTFADTI